jgi:hypothetical protein
MLLTQAQVLFSAQQECSLELTNCFIIDTNIYCIMSYNNDHKYSQQQNFKGFSACYKNST